MIARLTLAGLLFTCLGLTACADGTPTAPSTPVVSAPPLQRPLPPAPTVPAPDGTPSKFEVLTFTVHASPPTGARASYTVKLQLRAIESGGGAFIDQVSLVDAHGNTDLGCGVRNGIPPGATWDIDSMDYCGPMVPTSQYVETVTVIIRFTGFDGSQGTLTRTADVTR